MSVDNIAHLREHKFDIAKFLEIKDLQMNIWNRIEIAEYKKIVSVKHSHFDL